QEVGGSGAASHEDRPSSRSAEQPRRSRGEGLPRVEDSSADHDDRRYRESGRDRDRQRNRQPGPDTNFSPRLADSNRRDSRSLRESPGQFDGDSSHPDMHQSKRVRDDSASDIKLEPPRQRLATPTSMSNVREPSPPAPGASTSSTLAPSAPQAAKPSNEEVDRKRKELRAQLLKQQEEKQKQKDDSAPAAVSAERRERDSRGDSSRHSSRERAGVADTKESSGRRGRRTYSRQSGAGEGVAQQQQQQQSEPNDGRDRNA
ncbi:hypothetical protein IWW47_006160, partial [Coemansia sp. RSA 2052]